MTTNGGSLEDCHTNVFALTELNGLKWKCLTTPLSQRAWTSLEQDPVLSAYAKCLQAGILCAWRRQPPQPTGTLAAMQLPDYRIDVVKELWVFWYSQEEPDCLAEFTSHLACGEDGQGNWSVPGIQYETRTLFFKALHNLIERNLLKNGYIRIGKYFTRPYEVPSSDRIQCSPSYVNGISFNFFVHGENTVCATVSIQRQPTLFRLSRRHLDLGKKQSVILGPWSMRALLLPEQPRIVDSTTHQQPSAEQPEKFASSTMQFSSSCREPVPSSVAHQVDPVPSSSIDSCGASVFGPGTISKAAVDKLWSEWLQFFCLIINDERNVSSADTVGYVGYSENTSSSRSSMPKMVLVDVDGVHMWYPSSLIVVQASDDLLMRCNEKTAGGGDEDSEFAANDGSSFTATTPPATGHARLRSTPSFRRRRKKPSECENGPSGGAERHNMMYGTMVNGARAAQRFFEESCIAPSNNRRKESTESPSSSGLGLLMSAATSDDDCRWNYTDGMRRKDREESCACHQCQMHHARLQQSTSTTSILSSQCGTVQQDSCVSQEPMPSCSTSINFTGDDAGVECAKEGTAVFHRRSPSCTRSPSPPRSPSWEKKVLASSTEATDSERILDWIREGHSHSSRSGSRSGRADVSQEDRHQCPKTPDDSGTESPEYRRVQRSSLRAFRKIGSCKPVYQNLSPTSRPRSPACDASQTEPLNRLQPKDCLNGDFGSSTSSRKHDLTVMEGKAGLIRGLHAEKGKKLRGRFGRKRKFDDKLEWSGIETLDVSFLTAKVGEDDDNSDDNGVGFTCWSKFGGLECKMEGIEQMASPPKVSTPELRPLCSISQTHDGLRSLPVFSQGGSGLPSSTNASLASGVFNPDCDAQTSFLDDCNPSTVAMIERRSPADPTVTDSVHLSPPASNERVEPSQILGGTVANVLARVGGPPSVGDYMIYPTPPSVDATQSQQFSPQNTLIQTNPTSILYPPAVSYMTATSLCHNLPSQLPPGVVSEADISSGAISCMKREVDDADLRILGKLRYSVDDKPVYGKFMKLEMALSGKFAGNIFAKDFLSMETRDRVLEGVYSDQLKLIMASVVAREKRKKPGRAPDYLYLRERLRNLVQHPCATVRHYRLPLSNTHFLSSQCMPSSQMMPHAMSMNGMPNFAGNGPPFSAPSYSGGNSMMSMMMGGCLPSGGAMMQPMPASSHMGMVHINQQMSMAHFRPPARMPPLSYSSSQPGPPQHPAFMGQPGQFCGPPGMLSNPNQMCSFSGSPMCAMGGPGQGINSPSPMPPHHMLGAMHAPPQQPPGASGIHGTGPTGAQFPMQPQQPFQQLSHFVNNANFNGQLGMPPMNPSQQHMYQQQMMFRSNMGGNLTPQHAIHSPDTYGMDSQGPTPIEPPPPFSQAVNNQYSAMHNVQAGSMMYSQSPHMMRPNSVMQQAQNPNMAGGPRTPQNPIMGMHPSIGSPNNGGLFGNRLMNMPPVVDTAVSSTIVRAHPEGKSLVLAVLLQDTVLDLHYDSVFDACPICSCNGNIRAKELGVYITPPEVLRQPPAQQQLIVSKPTSGFYNNTSNSCNCGFSAVRHRYLSMKAGLFAEDAKEATDITETQSQPAIPHTIWFDSMSGRDMNFIALLREQTLVRDLGGLVDQVTLLSLQCERASQVERVGSDSSKQCEYIISEVDQRELPLVFQAACEVACMEMNCRRPPHDIRSVLLHDWGVQVANEMREPRESECMAILQEIGPVLEESLRIARSSPLFGSNNIVEGPLTWRFFDRKSLKAGGGVEDDSAPEPVPNIAVASEKDAIITSPQILRMWEKMTLEPYDQPKDVLYIGVVPDNLICIEKTKKYFADLSRMYEQCRFGRHIPFAREVLRDGLLRIPSRYPATNPGECDNFLNQVERHIGDNKSLIARLKVYMQYFENEVARILISSDEIFNRDRYRAFLAESQMHSVPYSAMVSYQCGGFAAPSSAADQMPPPSAPGSILNSGQTGGTPQGPSSVSGPSSVGGASSSIGESLTPDSSAGDVAGQNMSSISSFMAEQLADGTIPEDEAGTLPHVVVIYLVNPFLLGAEENPLVARVVTVALMRAFNALLYRLNNKRRPQLQLEIISLQNIFDYTGVSADFLKDDRGRLNGYDQGRLEKSQNERLSSSDSLKTIAFSVYSQSRVVLPEIVRGVLPKSMTRFGPASAMVDLLNDLERKEPVYYKIPSKPFILAPPSPVMQRANGDLMQLNTDEAVLFVSYCLIGNDWLAATVTDHQGHLFDNCLINLRLKPDHKRVNMRYKQSTQVRDSLYRLWSYILGTLATGTKNWRLVIGRVGRIGHGEFKFWTQILSKSYLKQVGTRMKHACRACHVMPGTSETPGLLSACLVSLEPEAHLRVFPSSFQHDERFLKNARYRTLTTPDDSSCTHILVFPTSPELNLDHQGGNGAAELEEDDFSNLLTEEIGEEFSDLIGNGEDLMTNATGPPPHSAGFRLGGNTGIPSEYADVSIENQPLATGYYISTAPASDLPDWFWSACPSAKRRNPVHLKSSLHLNTPNVQQGDDISSFGKGTEACHHQLDSQATADVLRYVLETYNALSWLNMDFVTGERRSCLPVHVQALMRLCNTVNRFIN